MMIWEMNLDEGPFELIKSGQKTVEMRLCKNDRDLILPKDHILFHLASGGDKIEVLVLNITKFPSFAELYKAYDKIALGYRRDETPDPNDMLTYYSKKDIEKYGVIAIEIKLI